MPQIKIDRNLLGRLADRYCQLELENRAYRAIVERAKRENVEVAQYIELLHKLAMDLQQSEWIDIDSQLRDAWTVEDDATFLRLLATLLAPPANEV